MTPPRAPRRERWEALRYGTLLPWTSGSRLAGRVYARLCETAEYRLDEPRRAAGVARIGRWLGVDARQADAIFRRTLSSEAREEADVSWYMHHPDELARAFRPAAIEPATDGPAIWATLHLGSPNLAYVYLRRVRGLDAQIVARPLDDANPMNPAKRAWGHRKVGWLERETGDAFLGTSAEALAIARSRLVKGASVFVLMDVPGDVVSRAITVTLFGERVRIASGLFVLAGMVGVPIRPVVAVPRGDRFELRYGDAITPVAKLVPTDAVERALTTIIRDAADEWWLWPYLPAAS